MKPKTSVKKSLNQEKKVIKATARMTPGIAYPEIENKLKLSKNLLLDILFPKFMRKEKLTKRHKVDDFVDDFKKSKAPQFKGKSADKKRKMAVAAYLSKQND